MYCAPLLLRSVGIKTGCHYRHIRCARSFGLDSPLPSRLGHTPFSQAAHGGCSPHGMHTQTTAHTCSAMPHSCSHLSSVVLCAQPPSQRMSAVLVPSGHDVLLFGGWIYSEGEVGLGGVGLCLCLSFATYEQGRCRMGREQGNCRMGWHRAKFACGEMFVFKVRTVGNIHTGYASWQSVYCSSQNCSV